MPSLILQDAFAPYYADRKSFPAERKPSVAGVVGKILPAPKIAQPQPRQPTKADKTTEH